MDDSLSTAWGLINDRLDELQALLTDGPVDAVTVRYGKWKSDTRAALAGILVESAFDGFDLAGRQAESRDGRRPTPPVFLDGAASRAFLTALKGSLEADPAAVLRLPPSEPVPARRLGLLKVIDLLERRLPRAFRERPAKEQDVQDGFETLLVGASIAYERERDLMASPSGTCVPDFTFPDLQTALELKLCDRPDRLEEIVVEIDHRLVACRRTYSLVIFGVCDLGFIRDADRFSATFEAGDGVRVIVIKV